METITWKSLIQSPPEKYQWDNGNLSLSFPNQIQWIIQLTPPIQKTAQLYQSDQAVIQFNEDEEVDDLLIELKERWGEAFTESFERYLYETQLPVLPDTLQELIRSSTIQEIQPVTEPKAIHYHLSDEAHLILETNPLRAKWMKKGQRVSSILSEDIPPLLQQLYAQTVATHPEPDVLVNIGEKLVETALGGSSY